ncbi:hypothetical protein NDU88_004053 [Pleurodeles waltl]|uniref:ribonuclease H n=1 Tax=Pleurodeles waltl TaxID=8319 RepID=A0AAV7WUQ8_PLEWA|nr:hypothetical protein NDU88_004053 [Pleurodeles waltl]
MDLSPLVALPDAINGPTVSQSLKLLMPQTPGAVVQQVPLPNASNVSLRGLTAQQLKRERIDKTMQEAKESIHTYYERLLKAFKEYSGKEAIEPKDMLHFVVRFVEGLRPEVGQMIKSHLICWQAKPIDEVLQCAKYCSDEIELKQKKLKEKEMMMQIKAAQTGVQGALVQQIPQQQGAVMFQPQARGRDRRINMNRGMDLSTVVVHNDVQGMKKMLPCHLCRNVGHWKRECPMMVQDGVTNSDDEEEQAPETENETINEEYLLIEFFPMFTVKELHADLQGTVQENVWDLTGKEVGLVRRVEPIKITLKPNVVFPQLPQYNMAQNVLMKVAQIIGDFLKRGVLKEVLSSPCNSPIMGLKTPCGKVRIVQDFQKVNKMVVKCCSVVPNPAVILFQIPCDAEWFAVVDLSQAFFSVPLHEDSQFLFSLKFLDRVYSWRRLPQGYTESPSLFNRILKKNLESLEPPYQSTLVQYIEDLLIASKTRGEC